MSNDAFSSATADLPADMGGHAAAEFEPLVRTFARLVGNRRGAGGALSVHRHGRVLAEVWTGEAAPGVAWTRDTGSIVFSATKGIAATVVHRLADRGLIDYDLPVAAYWPEFGAAGKDRITVRQLLTHRAGLSGLAPIAAGLDEVLDHRLMEQRLAAAKPDRLLGVPAYHALTFGWLLSGLARSVTGRGMGELIRSEVAEPLGIDGMYLGRPPADTAMSVAALSGSRLAAAGSVIGAMFLGRASGIPGAPGAATRALFLPGLEALLEGDEPPILNTELAAGNGVCTSSALATMYGALACGGTANGRQYLSANTIRSLRKVQTLHLDHALFYLPMLWHLGYHSLPAPGAPAGFGHIGLGGSFGWADPRSGLSIGFVHNRLTLNKFAWDQIAASWILPLAVRNARPTTGPAHLPQPQAA